LPPPANGYRPPTAAYPPAYPPPGAYPPPQSYPPQGTYPPQGGYPQQGGYPPPGGYPGYPVYPANPYSYDPQALTIYQQEKKEVALALALEFVIPGVGSIYAGHARGAAITWGLTLGGFALILVWVADVSHSINDGTSSHEPNQALLLGAMGLIMGGRIYGLYDAYASTTDYNRQLAARLGLPAAFSLGVTPIKSGHNQMAWGPSLSLRF
jgi:TM2 domain-containing membrane protein YozV